MHSRFRRMSRIERSASATIDRDEDKTTVYDAAFVSTTCLTLLRGATFHNAFHLRIVLSSRRKLEARSSLGRRSGRLRRRSSMRG